jgi:integrase
MGRAIHKLTTRQVETIAKPGRHSDGGGLYLVVSKEGRRKWVFISIRNGKRQDMGLGSAAKGAVSLAKAREAAALAREAVAAGRDPIAARRAAARDGARLPTFGQVADELVTSLTPEWRNEKHRAQWAMTLTKYAAPLRDIPVDRVATDDVLRALKPLWTTRPETASRLRGRIERVLDAAKALGHRSGENPALWRGHLANLLPRRQKLTRGHHAAMPYGEVPAFVGRLREREALAALALEFTIVTAARSGETYGARWSEIDLDSRVWTVPAARMKGGREHRVPLTERAIEIVDEVAKLRSTGVPDGLVFPGRRPGRPLSVMAMEMLLRRMGQDGVTVHGFRSSFRDWAGECTSFPREIAEAALAHVVGDQTERAYRRGDALEKRRGLMEAWASFCEPQQQVGDVVPARLAVHAS